jgi:hypothetical protein
MLGKSKPKSAMGRDRRPEWKAKRETKAVEYNIGDVKV